MYEKRGLFMKIHSNLLCLSLFLMFGYAPQAYVQSISTSQEQALQQRVIRETKQAIKGTMLDNNSLPTEQNRQQWVEAFVSVYESPYTLSRLTQQEKNAYTSLINDFFRRIDIKNISLENPEADMNSLDNFYKMLSPNLQAAIRERIVPVIEKDLNNALENVMSYKNKFNELKSQEQRLLTEVKTASSLPYNGDPSGRLAKIQEELKQTEKLGLQYARKAAIDLARFSILEAGKPFPTRTNSIVF